MTVKKSYSKHPATNGGLLLLLLSTTYFVSYLTRLNFSAVTAELTSDEVAILTKTEAGTVTMALFITYAVGQIVSGMLSDRFLPERVIGAGFLLAMGCNILMPFAAGKTMLMVAVWGANGFAQALFWPPIVKLMSAYYDDEGYAHCNWAVSVAAHLSTIVVYIATAGCVKYLDWKVAFFGAAILAGLTFVLFTVGFAAFRKTAVPIGTPRPVEKRPNDTREGRVHLLRLLFGTGAAFLTVAIAAQGFLKDGVQNWLPNFFTEVFTMSSSGAILSNTVLPIFNILVVSLATVLYQKVFRHELREAMLFFGTVIACSLLLTLTMGRSAVLCLFLAALITGCAHGINLMLISFVPRRFAGTGRVSLVSGILNACTYVGSAASSYGVAAVATRLGWRFAVLSWGAVALVGILACLLAYRRWGRFLKATAETRK